MLEFREFIKHLEDFGELKRIKKEVDVKYEITAVMKKAERENGPALLFENVKGYKGMTVVGNLYTTEGRVAIGVGAKREELDAAPKAVIQEVVRPLFEVAKGKLKEPTVVKTGFVKDVVVTKNPDVLKTVPVIAHCEKDGGSYISAGMVIGRFPETGERVIQLIEMQVKGPNQLAISPVTPMFSEAYKVAENLNQKLEVAVVIGIDPDLMLAACCPAEFAGADKYMLAGALRGEPLKLVKCETVDLEVPANAEFVIEGEMPPHERTDMGPYGDYFKTYYWKEKKPYINVKAITHRENPVYQDILADGRECALLLCIPAEIDVLKSLKETFPYVKEVYIPRTSASHHVIISMKKYTNMDAKAVIYRVLSSSFIAKHCIVVDEDIDVSNWDDVDWAIVSRVQADKDIIVIPELYGSPLDPSIKSGFTTAKMGVDATIDLTVPKERYERSDVPKDVKEKVEKEWSKYFE